MEDTKYQIKVNHTIFDEFQVITGLKQGDALSPLLLNLALEKVIRSVQNNKCELEVSALKLDVLGFADNLNLIGKNKGTAIKIQPL